MAGLLPYTGAQALLHSSDSLAKSVLRAVAAANDNAPLAHHAIRFVEALNVRLGKEGQSQAGPAANGNAHVSPVEIWLAPLLDDVALDVPLLGEASPAAAIIKSLLKVIFFEREH
jgi:hypothetical protein